MRTTQRRRMVGALALVLALAAFPLGALASHDFADVPNTNPFHNDISALAASGVTTGCGGGNYCPSAFVTREQMAAFLNRLGNLDGEVGHFNCGGRDMQPMESGEVYATGSGARYISSGSASFSCGVVLPDGATVTAFRGFVRDNSSVATAYCALHRHELAVALTSDEMAYPPVLDLATTLGDTVLEDTTINFPVIDNTSYGYSAFCFLGGPSLYLNGIQLEYTVSGLPVI